MNKKFQIMIIITFFLLLNFVSKGEETLITWRNNIFLHEDFTIGETQTLVIEPGTTIYLDSGVSLKIKGRLDANGEKQKSIKFIKNNSGKWRGIYIIGGNATLKYCNIENSIDGLQCKNGETIVENCTITNSTFNGVTFIDKSSGKITNTLIENISVGIAASTSILSIKNNIITNSSIGIWVFKNPNTSILSNIINHASEWGIRISSCKNIEIEDNMFIGEDSRGRIIREWYLIIKTWDLLGFLIDNCPITIYNFQGKKIAEEEMKTRFNDRLIAGNIIAQYIIDNNGTKIACTPHTIQVEKNGVKKTVTITLDQDKEITITLPILTLPSITLILIITASLITVIYLTVKHKRKK